MNIHKNARLTPPLFINSGSRADVLRPIGSAPKL